MYVISPSFCLFDFYPTQFPSGSDMTGKKTAMQLPLSVLEPFYVLQKMHCSYVVGRVAEPKVSYYQTWVFIT